MKVERQETQNQIDWRRMHALGLPAGSVRALLAVLVFATVWGMQLVRPSQEVPDYLSDLMFVIMGHYFATRKRNAAVEVPGDEPGPPPLFLPSGSIRLLLAGARWPSRWCSTERGVNSDRQEPRGDDAAPGRRVPDRRDPQRLDRMVAGRVKRRHRAIEDMQALAAMGAGVVLVALVWNRMFPVVPLDQVDAVFNRWGHLGRLGPEHLFAAVIGFYYGSRS